MQTSDSITCSALALAAGSKRNGRSNATHGDRRVCPRRDPPGVLSLSPSDGERVGVRGFCVGTLGVAFIAKLRFNNPPVQPFNASTPHQIYPSTPKNSPPRNT